ncbi:hypothetical protein ACFQ6Q_17845, partial [Streptomyces sp. NPDC056437]
MGIRSLLRKVFGRDRSEPTESTAASVPPQSERTETATTTSPSSATVPAPTPADRAADLVSAAFDKPAPKGRKKSVPHQARTEPD